MARMLVTDQVEGTEVPRETWRTTFDENHTPGQK